MKPLQRSILEMVVAATTEPILVVQVDQPDWPVVLANVAFSTIGVDDAVGSPFADVVEAFAGRELALEVSETVRAGQETSFPVEMGSREYLLNLKPLQLPDDDAVRFYGAFWRGGAGSSSADSADLHHALLKAKRRIRDLSRDDPVTGLLNGRAFRDVFAHDWAVAAREKTRLSVVVFRLNEFEAYVDVFGRHAADSCLRRASDVVARPDGACFVALSHASDEDGVREFAARIATAVRELGLHHPRSSTSKFVTVSFDVVVAEASSEKRSAGEFLDDLLGRVAE